MLGGVGGALSDGRPYPYGQFSILISEPIGEQVLHPARLQSLRQGRRVEEDVS